MHSIKIFLLCTLALLASAGPAGAEPQLSESEKELIALARLPAVSMNYAYEYKPGDFDPDRWGDRTEKISRLSAKLAGMDASTDPPAYAGTSYELALLLTHDKREQEARPHREKAVRLLQAALAKGPRSADLLYQAGRAQDLLGTEADAKAARDLYTEALKADPGFCMPYLQMIDNGSDTALLREAESCSQKAAGRKDATAEDHYQNHVLVHKLTAIDLATARMPAAVVSGAAQEDSPVPMVRLLKAATSDRAMEPLRKAADLDPKNVKYQASLGALQALRLFAEQITHMLNDQPGTPPEDSFRASAKKIGKEQKDLLREVKERFHRVEQQAGNTYAAHYGMWSIPLILEGKYEEAEQKLLKAVALNPEEERYSQTLLMLYRLAWAEGSAAQQERYSRFAGVLEKKCSSACSTIERRAIAKIRLDEHRYADAEKQLRAAVAGDPQSLPARTGLAVSLLRQHRVQEAMNEAMAAEQYASNGTDEEKAHFCSLAALMLLLDGDRDGALTWLERAYAIYPDDPLTVKLAVPKGK